MKQHAYVPDFDAARSPRVKGIPCKVCGQYEMLADEHRGESGRLLDDGVQVRGDSAVRSSTRPEKLIFPEYPDHMRPKENR